MKIKRKVEKNLPQLIDWAWDNGIKNKEYQCDGVEYKTVIFNGIGWAKFSDGYSYNKTDTFTVEVEEEITEDTKFKHIVCINVNDETVPFSDFTVRELKHAGIKEFHAYIDGEFKCIWRNGKLVV